MPDQACKVHGAHKNNALVPPSRFLADWSYNDRSPA